MRKRLPAIQSHAGLPRAFPEASSRVSPKAGQQRPNKMHDEVNIVSGGVMRTGKSFRFRSRYARPTDVADFSSALTETCQAAMKAIPGGSPPASDHVAAAPRNVPIAALPPALI